MLLPRKRATGISRQRPSRGWQVAFCRPFLRERLQKTLRSRALCPFEFPVSVANFAVFDYFRDRVSVMTHSSELRNFQRLANHGTAAQRVQNRQRMKQER